VPRSVMYRAMIVALTMSIAAAGCGGNSKKPPASTSAAPSPASSTPTTAPPSYSPDQIKAKLLGPNDIAPGMASTPQGYVTFPTGKIPACSLTPFGLAGNPETTSRILRNPKDQTRYKTFLQITARYASPQSAATDFAALEKALKACPAKRHVPPKKVTGNTSLAPHDDVWKLTEESAKPWPHLHADETETEPPGYTKHNVFNYYYDYVQVGNLLLTSVYLERTNPGEKTADIAQRAATILGRQLQKLAQ